MHESSVTPDGAFQMLLEGNKRFTNGNVERPHQDAARRAEIATGQHPFAIVLGCADSRVPPEVFFDQGIGDLFIIRNAGNIIDDVVLGSMEYAVEHLGTPLIMVLGHTKCGAVTATVGGGEVPGHIGSIVQAIKPAAEATANQGGDKVLNATVASVRMSKQTIETCEPILAEFVKKGKLLVVGGLYHIDTGEVEIIS